MRINGKQLGRPTAAPVDAQTPAGVYRVQVGQLLQVRRETAGVSSVDLAEAVNEIAGEAILSKDRVRRVERGMSDLTVVQQHYIDKVLP